MQNSLVSLVDRYLQGAASFAQLEVGLVQRLQSILDSGDSSLIKFANSVDADLIEYNEGLVDDAELRARLEGHLRRAELVTISRGAAPTSTLSSNNALVRASFNHAGRNVTLRMSHAFA
jgi:hypothetical protein